MLALIHPSEPDYRELEFYYQPLNALGRLYASLFEDGIGSAFFTRVTVWPTFTTREFTAFAKEKRPRALIILAYYLIFVKLMKTVWWVEGIADREIGVISRLVGEKWHMYMEIPLEAANLNSDQDIVNLLLGLPSQDLTSISTSASLRWPA
jgi:hypothetical protein